MKKFIAMLLAILTVVGMFPVAAFAEEPAAETYVISSDGAIAVVDPEEAQAISDVEVIDVIDEAAVVEEAPAVVEESVVIEDEAVEDELDVDLPEIPGEQDADYTDHSMLSDNVEIAEFEQMDTTVLPASFAAVGGDGFGFVAVGSRNYRESEPNNGSRVNLIYNDYTVRGRVSGYYDYDYFRFTLTRRSKVQITLVADYSTLRMRVANSANRVVGKDITGSYIRGNYAYGLVGTLSAGNYRLILDDMRGYYNDYLFYITITPVVTNPTLRAKFSAGKPYLYWSSVPGVTRYQVYRGDRYARNFRRIATTTRRYYRDSYAYRGGCYTYKVRGITASGTYTPWSSTWRVTM